MRMLIDSENAARSSTTIVTSSASSAWGDSLASFAVAGRLRAPRLTAIILLILAELRIALMAVAKVLVVAEARQRAEYRSPLPKGGHHIGCLPARIAQ